jgi:cysteinyl-tRNA synthetase
MAEILAHKVVAERKAIYLTNTSSRKKEKFVSLDKKEVRIYTCGPTVYSHVHIGNLRSYLAADILKRTLSYNGYKIKHAKNITDVGHMRTETEGGQAHDPVISEAQKQGQTPQQIAEKYTKTFLEDEKKLNILPADTFPKATDHIKEMIELTKNLLEKGFAYETSGTVYFDVKKFKNYGQLSGNTLEKMDKLLEAVRVSSESDKKDSADFALWKKADPTHILQWDSPWGKGYPGWHIECSAMSMKHLGGRLDIHTGGEDNIFPHHENEIAQSEAATGKPFVKIWLHGGWLLVDGKKMARREGTIYTVDDIQKKGFSPLSFRYLTLTAHYRARLNFTWESLKSAETALHNLYREVTGYATESQAKIGCAEYEQKFLKAVNSDLDTPKALAVMWDLVDSDYPPSAKLKTLYKFDEVLALDLEKVANEAAKVPKEVTELVNKRQEARKKNDFSAADKIRKQISEKGYEVVDTKDGQKLKRILN